MDSLYEELYVLNMEISHWPKGSEEWELLSAKISFLRSQIFDFIVRN